MGPPSLDGLERHLETEVTGSSRYSDSSISVERDTKLLRHRGIDTGNDRPSEFTDH